MPVSFCGGGSFSGATISVLAGIWWQAGICICAERMALQQSVPAVSADKSLDGVDLRDMRVLEGVNASMPETESGMAVEAPANEYSFLLLAG